MTYSELYEAVRDYLPDGTSFCLDVETWCHGGGPPKVVWSLWLADGNTSVRGHSASEVWEELTERGAASMSDVDAERLAGEGAHA